MARPVPRPPSEVAARALEIATIANTKIDGHEKTCAERYQQILAQLSAIFRFQWKIMFGVLGVAVLIITYYLTQVGIPNRSQTNITIGETSINKDGIGKNGAKGSMKKQ